MTAPSASAGVALRCVARVTGSTDGVYITGNALELVRPGQADGERCRFSRIFEPFSTDREVCETEVLRLTDNLCAGANAAVIVAGHHRGGHAALVDVATPLLVDRLFDIMQQRQAVAGGQGAQVSFQLTLRAACAVIGSAERVADLLSPGSSELRIVRDAEATGGVRLSELRSHPVAQSADFVKLFRGARSRLAQQHKPPAPSSIFWLELSQTSRRTGLADDELVSQLVVADVEVANLGDGIAAALRTIVSTPPTQPPPPSGAALILSEAFGGNAHTLLLGCVLPSDTEESAATLNLLAHGLTYRNFPLTNSSAARGLLHRHYWHTQTLQEQLVIAEGKLHRGVEQLASGQQQLPNQLVGATERLQALVDSMQLDAGGQSNERQKLMAEVMALRTQLNAAMGESVRLKEELKEEKVEKIHLSRQLLDAQLSSTDATVKEQQKALHLEQQAVAAADVLQQQQKHADVLELKLRDAIGALAEAESQKHKLETQRVQQQAELRGLQAESAEWREREDELNMHLLNAANGRSAAEAEAAKLKQGLETRTREKDLLLEKAEAARAELLEARAEADSQREQAASARLALERSQLEADQDTLALQRQAASSAEEQLERIRSLQAELSATRDEQGQERAAHANALALARDEVTRHDQMRGEINMQLDAHKGQLAALHKHIEILTTLRQPAGRAPAAAAEGTVVNVDRAGGGGGSAPAMDVEAADLAESIGGSLDAPAIAPSRSLEAPPAKTMPMVEAPPKLLAELVKCERQVTATLEANRGLVEAYWRVRMLAEEAGRLGQPLSLPSHEELNLSALVLPGAHGRRSVPSELEKALSREKDAIENQLTAARTDLLGAQQMLQQTLAAKHREATALEKELCRVRELASEEAGRAERLHRRVDELEAAVPAARNAELVVELRRTQEELIQQLTALKGEGGLDPLPASQQQLDVAAPAGLEADAVHLNDAAHGESDDLRAQIRVLERQLDEQRVPSMDCAGGSVEGSDARHLRIQIRELEAYQAQLERERSEYARRAAYAEEQLNAMQAYVDENLGKYQREILRLQRGK